MHQCLGRMVWGNQGYGASSWSERQRRRTAARCENGRWLRVHWGQNQLPENFHTTPLSPSSTPATYLPPPNTHTHAGKPVPFPSALAMGVCAKLYLNPKGRVTPANPWVKLISAQSKTWSLRTSQKNALDRTLLVASRHRHRKKCVEPKPWEKRSGSGFRIDWIQKLKYLGDSHFPFVPLLVDLFRFFIFYFFHTKRTHACSFYCSLPEENDLPNPTKYIQKVWG